MDDQIEKWSEEDRAKVSALIDEKRDRHHQIHGRLPTTGEEYRFYTDAVRDISSQRRRDLANDLEAYKKGKYGLKE